MRRSRTVAALVAVLLLAGCGADQTATGPAPTTPPATETTPATPPETTPGGSVTTPHPKGSSVTVEGTVEPGVEAGCKLLGGYLLLGGDPEVVKVGARVRVTGATAPNVMTTCMQGIPLQVNSAEPLG